MTLLVVQAVCYLYPSSLRELKPDIQVEVCGQELNPQSYAICKADMLIKGEDASHVALAITLPKTDIEGKIPGSYHVDRSAGVPANACVFVLMILSRFGLPAEAFAMILAVYTLLDMGRLTAVNIIGDLVCDSAVAEAENLQDRST